MNLEEALDFTAEMLRKGFKSDGCTLAPDLGIKRFCQMHDVLWGTRVVSARKADDLFYEGIMTKGKRYFPIAVIYWLAVRAHALISNRS